MTNDLAKNLLARVKQIRKALGLSQEAFAERAGLKYKHYQALEAGRKMEFHFSTFEKLVKACGLKPSEILDFDTEPMMLAEEKTSPSASPAPAKRTRVSYRRKPPPKKR